LYPFLPVNHAAVGVPVVWIGVLLSINRFVRILSNTWIVHLLARYGLRRITIFAVMLAALSTAGYAIASGIFLWMVLRIAWGLAFSALRITTIGYSLQQSRQGLALGLTRGIQEAGPMVALFLTPLLLQHVNITHAFLVLTGMSLPALYFSWNLPRYSDITPAVAGGGILLVPSLVNAITFVSAFLIDGILVVVLGILFLYQQGNMTLLTATSLAAFYLGYRRLCLVLFSPAGGWLADRLGIKRVFNVSLVMTITGLLTLALGAVAAGAVITFTFYSVHAAITPGYVSLDQVHPLASVAANATWRDIGAALGTLAGGLLLSSSSFLKPMLIFGIFGMAILFLFHWGIAQRTLKFLYLWK